MVCVSHSVLNFYTLSSQIAIWYRKVNRIARNHSISLKVEAVVVRAR